MKKVYLVRQFHYLTQHCGQARTANTGLAKVAV